MMKKHVDLLNSEIITRMTSRVNTFVKLKTFQEYLYLDKRRKTKFKIYLNIDKIG
jgi:hypothetical protein